MPMRKLELLQGLFALALGALTAALPALLGEPDSEHAALRGVAVGVVVWSAAAALVLRLTWRSTRDAVSGTVEASNLARAVGLLRTASWIGLLLLFVALPALVLGVESVELAALSALMQSTWGWSTPIHHAALGASSLAACFALTRLAVWAWQRPMRSLLAVVGCLLLMLCFAFVAWSQLQAVSSAIGWERSTKGLALSLLLVLLAAALLAPARGASRRDLRTGLLAAGSILSGAVAMAISLDYLAPSAADLSDVRIEWEREGWTLLAGGLRDRPDLFGIFGLAPGSQRLELIGVGPGDPLGASFSAPQRVRGGLAHLTPREELPSREQAPFEGRTRTGRADLLLRSRWSRFLDRPTGLSISTPCFSWAVTPGLRFAVSTTLDRDWIARNPPERRRGSRPGNLQEFRHLTIAEPSLVRLQIELTRRSPLGAPPEIVARDLSSPPRVLWIDDRAVRFLIASGSGPGDLTAATFRFADRRWVDQRSSSLQGRPQVELTRDRRFAVLPCLLSEPRRAAWCRADLDQLGKDSEIGPRADPAPLVLRTMPLDVGGVALLWHSGGRPTYSWRLTIVMPEGAPPRTVEFPGSPGVRFAGELEDGSIAIAHLAGGGQTLNAPKFGWKLEAIDPSTGGRRILAEDLGTFPISHGNLTRVFLERSGRLVVPTARGLVDVRRGARSFRPTLDSTARETAQVH